MVDINAFSMPMRFINPAVESIWTIDDLFFLNTFEWSNIYVFIFECKGYIVSIINQDLGGTCLIGKYLNLQCIVFFPGHLRRELKKRY